MRVEIERERSLRFDGGLPVRAASAIVALGDGWLVAQDDATHAAWIRASGIVPVRVLPPVEGHETFSSAAGTKHLKPDFEAACPLGDGVLLLGSGSTPARMRATLLRLTDAGPTFVTARLGEVYRRVAVVLGIPEEQLNLEGACRHGDRMRWFQRGNTAIGVSSASVEVDLAALTSAVVGTGRPDAIAVGDPRRYDLGTVHGVALSVTDAVTLPDGRLLLSAAAEDTPNAVDDGPVLGAALALLSGDRADTVTATAPLPRLRGEVCKVEGLALDAVSQDGARLLAVVDADDPHAPSVELTLRVSWA